VNSLQSSVRMT